MTQTVDVAAEEATTSSSHPRVAFYTVADDKYFPGLVGLLNSLRLVGHAEPLFVVDAGMTSEQRERLAPHVTLLPAPDGDAAVLLTPAGPLQARAEVAVMIDADIVVVRSLSDVIGTAHAGRIVGFVNIPPNDQRSYPEWAPGLGLDAIRSQPYLNAGLIVAPRPLQQRLLQPWMTLNRTLDIACTRYGGARLTDPFYFSDQDVLNAMLSSSFLPDEIAILDYRLAPHPPFAGLTLIDAESLRCQYHDGEVPYLLHHTLGKPWLRPTRTTIYSRLLTRLLLHDDVTVRMRPEEVPLRLREGGRAEAARRRDTTTVSARTTVRRQLCRFGIRTRIADMRARRR